MSNATFSCMHRDVKKRFFCAVFFVVLKHLFVFLFFFLVAITVNIQRMF